MQKRLIVNHQLLEIMVKRLCHQLIEGHHNFSDSVILGLQPRGIYVAERIQRTLESITGKSIPTGFLDTTFHRDDFRRRISPLTANATSINFVIEDKRVILVDDVLYTGRSVRAAMDAMIAYGRPANVELLVLVDRLYTRHLPIEPTYVGRRVNSLESQRVLVEWQDQDKKEDNIWLINKSEE